MGAHRAPKKSLAFSTAWKAQRRKWLEDFVDFIRQHKVKITDSLHAVSIQVDDHFVPHVGPFRMMVHRFGHQRDARHVAESSDEIIAGKLAVELAVHKTPALSLGEQRFNLGFGKFFCWHVAFLRNRLAFSPAIMRRKLCPSNNSGFGRKSCKLCERLEWFFIECARELHYRRGFSRGKNTRCVSLFSHRIVVNVLATAERSAA